MLVATLMLVGIWQQAISSAGTARAMSSGTPANGCGIHDITGGGCAFGPVALTPEQQGILARKNALANEFQQVLTGAASPLKYQHDWQAFIQRYGGPTREATASAHTAIPYCVQPCGGGWNGVPITQQAQQTTYYCGPATASEILSVRSVNASEGTLAGYNYLQTDYYGGTNWGPPSVMQNSLNALTNSSFYLAVNGSAVGGGFSTSTWESDLQQDIN